MVVTASLIGCSNGQETSGSEANGETGDSEAAHSLNFGTTQTEDSQFSAALEALKEEVEEKSDGEISVNLHYNSSLGDEREMVEAVNMGNLEGVMTSTGVLSNFVPETSVLDLPFIFRDKEHARTVMDGEVADTLAGSLEDSNFKVLAWAENGFRHVTNSQRPIENPEDLDGIKLRTMEVSSHQKAFQEMGADPTPMGWGEVFTSLQQEVIDGQENPLTIIYQSKLFEVQDYLSLTGHVYSPTAIMLGNDIFEGMSEENQQILLDAAQTAKTANYEFIDEVETENIERLEDEGMEIIEDVDKEPFMEAVQPVIDEYKSEFPDLYEQIINTN